MLYCLPKKELIFFVPENSGAVFTYPANHHISVRQLLKTQENLVIKNNAPVIYVEDRRTETRENGNVPIDFLFRIGRTFKKIENETCSPLSS